MLSSRLLLILARTWLVFGSLSLVFASARLFRQALDAGLGRAHLYWIVPVAALAGAAKARFVMRRRMRANIARLAAATGKLWLWQIYPPQLLAFILSVVTLMAFLKRAAAGNGAGLGALGGVDVLVAVALGVASWEYRGTTGRVKAA